MIMNSLLSIIRRAPRALLGGIIATGLTGIVVAYSTNNVKWPTSSVTYYVNAANLDLSESAAEAAVRAGADVWNLQSNANLNLSYAGRTTGTALLNNGKNEVFFRNESNGSTIAATYWWYDANRKLIDADIKFYDAGFKFVTAGTACSGAMFVEGVATHEFGHALGLAHSGDSTATMYPSTQYCSENWRTLAADDIAGIESLYPPAGAVSLPSAPTTLAGSASSSSAVALTWLDNASNEDNNLVERSVAGGSWVEIARLGANVTSYTNAGLAASTAYSYRVRASNTGGFSAYSNTVSVTTPAAATAPSAPSSLVGSVTSSTSVALTWKDNASNEANNIVERSVAGGSWVQLASLGANVISYTNTGLSASTAYSYRVRASNTGGFSAYTNTVSVTTPAGTAAAPVAPTSPFPSNGSASIAVDADLSWNCTGATGYDVYFGTSSTPALYASNVASPSQVLPRLTTRTRYYWRIVAKNSTGSTSGPTWYFNTRKR